MLKVLIVEDEEIIRKGLIFMIDWMKADCVIAGEAANGKEGLSKIHELNPDILITDLKMPLMDGLTMIAESIDQYDYESIIVSGYGEFEWAQKAIRFGVTEYLLKPVHEEQLYNTLKKIRARIHAKKIYNLFKKTRPDETHSEVLDLSIFKNGNPYRSKYVMKTLEYIKNNYRHKISLAAISDELNISRTYLNQRLKKETSYTFNVFLNRYRIQQAINLLQSDASRVYEVAEKTGFLEYKYFIQVFKKYVGCSPTKFVHSRHAVKADMDRAGLNGS